MVAEAGVNARMPRGSLLKSMPERRLFWVAIGAFGSALAMLSGSAVGEFRSQKSEVLVISIGGLSEKMRASLLETVKECHGKFEVEYFHDDYEVRIPTQDLHSDEYECILRRSASIGDLVKPEDAYSRIPGKIWQGVTFGIRQP